MTSACTGIAMHLHPNQAGKNDVKIVGDVYSDDQSKGNKFDFFVYAFVSD